MKIVDYCTASLDYCIYYITNMTPVEVIIMLALRLESMVKKALTCAFISAIKPFL